MEVVVVVVGGSVIVFDRGFVRTPSKQHSSTQLCSSNGCSTMVSVRCTRGSIWSMSIVFERCRVVGKYMSISSVSPRKVERFFAPFVYCCEEKTFLVLIPIFVPFGSRNEWTKKECKVHTA